MMTVRLVNYNAARKQKEVVVYSLAINLMQLRNIWGSVSILILHLFHVYCMYFFSSFRSLSFAGIDLKLSWRGEIRAWALR